MKYPEEPVSRGKFLRSLGSSVTGMALNTGIASAAQAIAGRIAAAAETRATSAITPGPEVQDIPFIKHGPRKGNRIALTFDDGPVPGVTDRILDELVRRALHATFFMIGERIAVAPDLARRVLAEGHEIGNHTFTHPKLTTLPEDEVVAEIQKTQDIIAKVLNYRSSWFRPPFGALRKDQAPLLAREGLGIVMWSVDPSDWAQPGEDKIKQTILTRTEVGSIIVCHDLHAQTANSMGTVLEGLQGKNFEFSTLTQLMRG